MQRNNNVTVIDFSTFCSVFCFILISTYIQFNARILVHFTQFSSLRKLQSSKFEGEPAKYKAISAFGIPS